MATLARWSRLAKPAFRQFICLREHTDPATLDAAIRVVLVEAVLEAGDVESGVSIHLVDPEYDTGPIMQRKGPVLRDDSVDGLKARVRAHDGLSDLRVVESMHARKAMMAELADGFIALPGGWGTLEEFFEVLTWAQLGLHQKPCGLLNVRGFYDGLLSFIDHSIDERFVRRENRSMLIVSSSPNTLLQLFDRYVPRVVEKWIDDIST